MTIQRRVRQYSKAIRKSSAKNPKGYFAIIGKLDGTVDTGIANQIYVTTIPEGQTNQVVNRRVPNSLGDVVFVGSDEHSANKIEVLYSLNFSSDTNDGVNDWPNIVPPHSHSYPGYNTTWVFDGQIMPLNALPVDGEMTIHVYPGVIRKKATDGWKYIAEQDVDVSGDVPSTSGEALWITLQANDDGTVDYVVGTPAANRESLTEDDIPEPTGRSLFAVILEEGYNELFRNNVRNDFLDLRFDRGGGLSYLDASAVTYAPAELADWDYLADPGSVEDALNQLAARVADIEGLVPAFFNQSYEQFAWADDGSGGWEFVSVDDGFGNMKPLLVSTELD